MSHPAPLMCMSDALNKHIFYNEGHCNPVTLWFDNVTTESYLFEAFHLASRSLILEGMSCMYLWVMGVHLQSKTSRLESKNFKAVWKLNPSMSIYLVVKSFWIFAKVQLKIFKNETGIFNCNLKDITIVLKHPSSRLSICWTTISKKIKMRSNWYRIGLGNNATQPGINWSTPNKKLRGIWLKLQLMSRHLRC